MLVVMLLATHITIHINMSILLCFQGLDRSFSTENYVIWLSFVLPLWGSTSWDWFFTLPFNVFTLAFHIFLWSCGIFHLDHLLLYTYYISMLLCSFLQTIFDFFCIQFFYSFPCSHFLPTYVWFHCTLCIHCLLGCTTWNIICLHGHLTYYSALCYFYWRPAYEVVTFNHLISSCFHYIFQVQLPGHH